MLRSLFLSSLLTVMADQATAQKTEYQEPRSSLKLAQLLKDSNAEIGLLSCNLRAVFNQCRQYAVYPANAVQRRAEIAESCTSLGGELREASCPGEGRLARCRELKFRRDVYYDATYYTGPPSNWSAAELQVQCQHLPGQWEANETDPAQGAGPG